MPTEKIQLTLPASEEYEEIAQTAIAHLAIRRGFTLPEVEDLRLIMGEVTRLLLNSEGNTENIHLNYEVTKDHLMLEAYLDESTKGPLPQKDIERFSEVVSELLDQLSIDNEKNSILLTKYRLGSET
jgi:HEPN domain-containing protein|tara:strand:- start:297 stop:677 length:381 start_codon:yes stop_codon:yes gene_type:complete